MKIKRTSTFWLLFCIIKCTKAYKRRVTRSYCVISTSNYSNSIDISGGNVDVHKSNSDPFKLILCNSR